MKTSTFKTMMIIGMMTLGTVTTFGKTNTNVHNSKNQKQNTVIVINHNATGKYDRDKNCTCRNCIEMNKRHQHDKQMVGGYSQQHSLTKYDKQLFKSTYNGKGKDKLTPISVATQLVNGMNYKFICLDKYGKKVTVIIYQSLPHMGSKSRIVSINR